MDSILKLNCFFIGLIFLLFSCGHKKKEVPLVGLDKNGKVTEIFLSKSGFKDEVGDLIGEVTEESLEELEDFTPKAQKWRISRLYLGIGINKGASVTSSFGISAQASFRLIFGELE